MGEGQSKLMSKAETEGSDQEFDTSLGYIARLPETETKKKHWGHISVGSVHLALSSIWNTAETGLMMSALRLGDSSIV